MLIGLDFDGVIADNIFLKQKYAKIMYGINLNPEECGRKGAVTKGIDNEMYDKLGKHIYSTEASLEAPEIPEAINYIKELKRNNEIRIITARLDNSIDLVKKWLRKRNLELEVLVTNQKPKTEYVKGMQFFLDDDLEKLEKILDVVPFPCILDKPYNKKSYSPKVSRVSWGLFNEVVNIYSDSIKPGFAHK